MPGFPPQTFPTKSPPSHPLHLSLHSQQQPLPWDCATTPKLQFPAAATSRRLGVTVRGWYGCGKNCLILIPFRLPQISCFILSLKCFSSDSDSCPQCGNQIPALVSPPAEGRSSPTNTPVSPPTESCKVLYILFHSSGTPALSWCSACTSVFEGVFLMYLWREMYSTSTYSSTILFSSHIDF